MIKTRQRTSLVAVLKVALGCLFWVTLMGSHGGCDTIIVVDDHVYSDPYDYGDGYSDGYADGYSNGYYSEVYGVCGEITGDCGCWGPIMLGSYGVNS